LTLSFELDLDNVKLNLLVKHLGQSSFSSKVIVRTLRQTHTHTGTDCSTWTTKVVGKYTLHSDEASRSGSCATLSDWRRCWCIWAIHWGSTIF